MIGVTASLKSNASNIIALDVSQQANPANLKATPGYHYLLPETNELAPVAGILFYPAGVRVAPVYDGKPVATIFEMRRWVFNARSVHGEQLLRDLPLTYLRDGAFRIPHYFNALPLDPRQCWISTADINANKVVFLFSFLY